MYIRFTMYLGEVPVQQQFYFATQNMYALTTNLSFKFVIRLSHRFWYWHYRPDQPTFQVGHYLIFECPTTVLLP